MKEALDVAIKIYAEDNRAKALVELALYMPESMVNEIFDVVINIQNKYTKEKTLIAIIAHMPKSMMNKTLGELTNIQGKSYLMQLLTEIISKIPESNRDEVLKAALGEVTENEDESRRASELTKIIWPYLSVFSLDSLYPIWVKILHGSINSRGELLSKLGEMIPIIHKLGGEKALNDTFYAIQDVARWWP